MSRRARRDIPAELKRKQPFDIARIAFRVATRFLNPLL